MKTTLLHRTTSPPAARSAPAAHLALRASRPVPVLAALYSPQFLYAVMGGEFLCQIALLFPLLAKGRVFLRVAAFCSSLFMFFALRRPAKAHPASRFAVIALVTIAASIPRPDSDSVWAGVAALFLHLAILAPVFWVPRIAIDAKTVRRIFLCYWLFNTASAVVGALQAYFPGQFQPAFASNLEDRYIEALQITLSTGFSLLRPMGLTDTPGGAAMGGFYCVILGIGFLMDRSGWWFKTVVLVSMALGLFALYLCEVRSVAVMLAISIFALGFPLVAQRRAGRYAFLIAAVSAVAVFGFMLAISVAEKHVTDRFLTLFESDPGTVYYENRGTFLQHTFYELLPQYPLGAGLGRWGMIHGYFADSRSHIETLWAEIQWTAWLYDGGIPLMLAYGAAVATALLTAFRIAIRPDGAGGEIQNWATVLFGYGIGALALTFNSPMFEGTSGFDFWLLSATVFAASQQTASVMPHRLQIQKK
jgi:hypothetical protein